MIKKKIVKYEKIKLVVSTATVMIAMKRARLLSEAKEEEVIENEDKDVKYLRTLVHPQLVAATTEANGMDWPITLEDFLELPEVLWNEWVDAVFELNPHWRASSASQKAQQKKVTKDT